jgi:uncharacterized protein
MKKELIGKHEIRDPIHGAIRISASERHILDHDFIQRLRGIRQLGFTQHSFPSATHTRFSHSIGVMHIAGKIFDTLQLPISENKQRQFRSLIRMTALLHDSGHGPYSHAAEYVMPPKKELFSDTESTERATHEDYTVAILTQTDINDVLEREFGFSGKHVAALIDPHFETGDDFFIYNGLDLRTIFGQIISSNLDADRLDYLIRDSYFTGVRYGEVDVNWLVNNMGYHVSDRNEVSLALERSALYALENFLLARLHMFLMVYFHKKSLSYELLFREWLQDPECTYKIPSDLEEYKYIDDGHLWYHMIQSPLAAAQAIKNRNVYKVAFERHGSMEDVDLSIRKNILEEAGIPVLESLDTGKAFSKPKVGKPPIQMLPSELEGTRAKPLHQVSTRVHTAEVSIARLFVPPKYIDDARLLMKKLVPQQTQTSLL